MQVIKRNKQKAEFQKEKIVKAILKAFIDVDNEETQYAKEKAREIATYIERLNKELSVEEIQDIVEEKLMASNRKDVARAYVRYRYLRSLARKEYNTLMDAIAEKLEASNIQNQNANIDEASFGGRVGEASNLVLQKFALDYCMSEKSKENHLNNEIYIHDLNSYATGSHNCLTLPLDDLLKNGFNTRQTDVRPAQSINTAFQLVAVLMQLQSLMQFGGVAASHLDWTMVPYVRKSFSKHMKDGLKYIENIDDEDYIDSVPTELEFNDREANDLRHSKAYKYAMDMTTKECYQAVEGMFHNLNTLQSRSGNQLPFSSINFGTCTLPEGRLVTKAILETCIKGIGKLHKTSIFPCLIFQVMKGVNKEKGTPNYDLYRLALKSTSLRLYPNYANVDWSGNKGYDRSDPKTYFSTINKTVA